MRFAVGLIVLLFAGSGTTGTSKPMLRVIDEMPLVIRGIDFQPGESVRVSLALRATTRSARVIVSRTRAFTVRFTFTPVQCGNVRTVVATGNRGSYARITPALTKCFPPPAAAA